MCVLKYWGCFESTFNKFLAMISWEEEEEKEDSDFVKSLGGLNFYNENAITYC